MKVNKSAIGIKNTLKKLEKDSLKVAKYFFGPGVEVMTFEEHAEILNKYVVALNRLGAAVTMGNSKDIKRELLMARKLLDSGK